MEEEKTKEKVKIICIECGNERLVLPQNKATVKRCVLCQAIKNQEVNTALIKRKREEERKKIAKQKVSILNFKMK